MKAALRSLTLHRLVVLITFVGVFAMAMRTPLETDTLWHLRAGEWQVEQRALLREDLFSTSRYGEEWINHSWLSQIVLFGLYRLMGSLGLALYTALLAAGGMFFVYLQGEANALLKGFVIALAAAAAAVFWSPRPHMVSFLMSAVILYLLWLYRRRQIDRLWLIPALMVAWVNLHGGFAIGFILLVLAAGGALAAWLFDDVIDGYLHGQGDAADRRSRLKEGLRPVGRLIVVGLVSAAAVSLNPYGPQMLLYPFRTVGIGVLRDFIQEWAAPDFHMVQTWPFLWLLLLTLVFLGLTSRHRDWTDMALLAGTAYSALLAGRNIPTFALAAAPVLLEHADEWLEARGVHLALRQPPRGPLAAVNWLLALLAVGAAVVKVTVAVEPAAMEEARRTWFPVDALAYMEEENIPGPVFNSYNWGGFLIWEARDYPVYVDGRTDLYDDAFLRDYLAIAYAQPGWEEKLRASGANTVLIEPGSALAAVLRLSAGWDEVYADEVACVFVREGPHGD